MHNLTLTRAPAADHERWRLLFNEFIIRQNSPFVSVRSDERIRSAIEQQNLFVVLDADSNIVATTALYWHGPEDGWGEMGSTLVDPRYQGLALQVAIYSHIISLKHLSNYPDCIFAVVDVNAVQSAANIERKLGFERSLAVPPRLKAASGVRDWSMICTGKKHLYLLGGGGRAAALRFVAGHGAECRLPVRNGSGEYMLKVDFRYLQMPNAKELIAQEASRLEAAAALVASLDTPSPTPPAA